MEHQGLIHLYKGDGKGKTTAAMGLALRALGNGFSVDVYQFLKADGSSELAGLRQLGVSVCCSQDSGQFSWKMDETARAHCREQSRQCFEKAAASLRSAGPRLVVLDEILDAVNLGFLSVVAVADALNKRDPQCEAVLTGRDPAPQLEELADYLMDFHAVKHPYRDGIKARRGIEF